jgi:hypothetical protein
VALCVDLSPDAAHGTLAAAQVTEDGRVRVELLASWDGPTAASDMERALPAIVRVVKPRLLGWFPNGPAAAIASRMGITVRGTTVTEIRGETPAVVMGFAKEVTAKTLLHSGDPLLDAQVGGAERLPKPGGGWVFSRAGGGYVDAGYAAAGAVHLARTMPALRKVVRSVRS